MLHVRVFSPVCVCMCAPLRQKEPGGSSSARGTRATPRHTCSLLAGILASSLVGLVTIAAVLPLQ